MEFEKSRLGSCCFFGHRKITKTANLTEKLRETVKDLILNKQVNTFLFGSNSDFDKLCYKVVSELKESYSEIRRIYVRAEFPNIDEKYKNYLLERYEDTYYPMQIVNAGRAVYIKRNYEMIDRSACCVIYYDEGYTVAPKESSHRVSSATKKKSGTKLAYNYAKQKNLLIKNLFEKAEN